MDLRTSWNQSHSKIPKDRKSSSYARDKEKLFSRNSLVCDLGGGDGTDSFYFIKKGHKVYLYDISDMALKKAEQKANELGVASKIKISQLDLTNDAIPAEDGFFNVVYARLSLHYFLETRTIEILKDINRVLKQGGKAFLAVKSPEDKAEMEWLAKNNKKISKGVYSENDFIKSRYTKDQYKTFLKKAGVSHFSITDYVEHFKGKKNIIKSKNNQLQYIDIEINK